MASYLPGISFKTQLMYTVVFLTRYLELFRPFSLYLILMKVFFIASSVYILYLMKVEFKYVLPLPCATKSSSLMHPGHDTRLTSIQLGWTS